MVVERPTLDDVAELLRIARAADAAACGESDWTERDLRDDLERLDLDRDAWLVRIDGRVGGWATFRDRGGGRVVGDGYVDPELRGHGIGSLLLELTEARAAELAADAEGRVYLHNGTLDQDDRARSLYEGRGYRAVRHFWRMVADLEAAPDVIVPDGIEIRRYRHPDEARAVHAALEEAFLDHWNNQPRPFETWSERMFDEKRFDPGLWWVAADGGELAGAATCEWKRNGDWGWVGVLGVRRAWRRRGIGEALLHASFAEFFRRGERRVALGVDAQSETGATRLYERAGMRVFWEAVVWEKVLRAA